MKKYKLRIDRIEYGKSVAFINVALPDGVDPKKIVYADIWDDILAEMDFENYRWDVEHEISAKETDEEIDFSFSLINGEFVEDDLRDYETDFHNLKIG